MRRIIPLLGLVIIMALGFGVSAAILNRSSQNVATSTVATNQEDIEFTYRYVSRDDMIAGANAIVVGRVKDISPAQWNQEGGAFWEEEGLSTLPYHTVTIAINKILVNTIELTDTVTVTVLGGSPSGSSASAVQNIEPHADHSLKVEDKGIFFIELGQIAWRGGTIGNQEMKSTISFAGAPQASYLKEKADGLYHADDPEEQSTKLDKLEKKIKDRRKP